MQEIRYLHPGLLGPSEFQQNVSLSDKRKQLVRRFFSYLNADLEHAAKAVGACRTFNYAVYKELGDKLGFNNSEPLFKKLTSFSFVNQIQQHGELCFQVHQLLRRILRDSYADLLCRADKVLDSYYHQAGEDGVVDVIYHCNRHSWQAGIAEWVKVFDLAVDDGQFTRCRALLNLVPDLTVGDDFSRARLLRCEAEYKKAIGLFPSAVDTARQALVLFDVVLGADTSHVRALSEKASALIAMGEAHYELAHNALSLRSYEEAICSCNAALECAPDDTEARNNRAAAMMSIGEIECARAQRRRAIASNKQALDDLAYVLERFPKDLEALVNKGFALSSLGEIHSDLADYSAANSYFEAAIGTYEAALAIRNDLTARNNKAFALASMAHGLAKAGWFKKSIESARAAIAEYDEVVRCSPEDHTAHSNRARALAILGGALVAAHEEGTVSGVFTQAVAAADEGLRLAPEDVWAHDSSAMVTLFWARSTESTERRKSQHCYEETVHQCDASITLAEDDVEAHFLKGLALKGLARVGPDGSKNKYLGLAVTSLDEMLSRAPDDVEGHYEKGCALQELARLRIASDRLQAGRLAKRASAEFARAKELCPDDSRFVRAEDDLQRALENME